MVRGRKPKPTKTKELAGNPGKRPLNGGEPQPPVPERVPYSPRHLNEDARKEWSRVIGMLMDVGLYTEVDRAALAMYCQAWGRWVQAERKLAEQDLILTGEKGGSYQNPMLHVANKAQDQLRKMLPEFGFSPSARSRINIPGKDEPSLAEQLFDMAVSDDDQDE